MAVNDNVVGAVAIYDPNGPMAIIAFLAFGAVAVTLWIRYFRTKPRAKYMRTLLVGTTFMSLGFICRFSRRNGINAWSWLFETLFILLSPCAFLAHDYILIPRLAVHLDAEACLPFKKKALVVTFVLADIITVTAQLAGTALTITFGDLVSIGHKLATAGLWVQLACFSCFVAIYTIFGIRLRRRGAFENLSHIPRLERWSTLYFAIGASCICMTIRSIYRVAEYTAGAGSSLGQSEVAFYILDSVCMLINVSIFALVWPPHILGAETEEQAVTMVQMKKAPSPV